MKTFRQFLQENDPLNNLVIEMWLRNRFGLKHKDAIELRLNLEGKKESILQTDLFKILSNAYEGDIPYDVLKGRGDIDTDQWLVDKITNELKYAGLELE